jgi:DNA-binding CsgD family transcriptional regulator
MDVADLVTFLNALPIGNDTVGSILALRTGFERLLEVSKVVVNVYLDADLVTSQERAMALLVEDLVGGEKAESIIPPPEPDQYDIPQSQRILAHLTDNGYPVGAYHAPVMFDYHNDRHVYLGSLLIFSSRERAPITPGIEAFVDSLRPFVLHALTDIVARSRARRSYDVVYYQILIRIADEGRLTPQEQRVLVLLLAGHTYESAAEKLEISANGVRKHIKAIYRKLGVHSLNEIYGKYFSPQTLGKRISGG